MTKHYLLLLFLFSLFSAKAQNAEAKTGPIIKNYGKVFQIDSPELVLKKNTEYKIIFDIYTDSSNKKRINPLINTVARFINMHAQQGILMKNMKIAVILHGEATKNALNDIAYQAKYNAINPNNKLLHKLKKVNVELFVCGQSYLAKGFEINNKSSDVKLALSALTALVEYQSNGYQIINFN